MSTQHDRMDGSVARPRRPFLSLMIIPVIAFVAGIAAMGWILTQWTDAAGFIGITPKAAEPAPKVVQAPPPTPVTAQLVAQPTPAPQRLVIDPEISRRVASLEGRVSAINEQTRAAIGNADRAEGLLVAFAARRALDRGVALGYIEGLLRQRFGETQPQAVATIISVARQPVTLQQLQDELLEVSPALLGGGPQDSWWDSLKRELGSLITVRKAGTPSTIPAERLRRVTRRLETGEVDVALAEVLRMPGRQHAGDWITMARRYVAARRALDTIETAALLEPHMPGGTSANAPAAGAALPPPAR